MSKIIENIFYKQREDFYRKYKNRNKHFTFPEDITMTKGIPYATDGIKAHRLDIMEPSGTSPAEGCDHQYPRRGPASRQQGV